MQESINFGRRRVLLRECPEILKAKSPNDVWDMIFSGFLQPRCPNCKRIFESYSIEIGSNFPVLQGPSFHQNCAIELRCDSCGCEVRGIAWTIEIDANNSVFLDKFRIESVSVFQDLNRSK